MRAPWSSVAYMYTFGSAGTGSAYRNTLEALEQWRIVPLMHSQETVEDAHAAMDARMAGIVVSNHGKLRFTFVRITVRIV